MSMSMPFMLSSDAQSVIATCWISGFFKISVKLLVKAGHKLSYPGLLCYTPSCTCTRLSALVKVAAVVSRRPGGKGAGHGGRHAAAESTCEH
eukprot:1157397-Pelagomonas_calceolata.AAC.6